LFEAMMLRFTDDSRHLIGQSGEGRTIVMWEVVSGKMLRTLTTPEIASCLAPSPDASLLFVAVPSEPNKFHGHSQSQAIWAYDWNGGEPVRIADLSYLPRPERHDAVVEAIHPLGGGDALAIVLTEYFYPMIPVSGPPGRSVPPVEKHFAWVIRRK